VSSNAAKLQQQAADPGILLPDSIVSPLDFGQILRELFALDQFLSASKAASKLPFTSPALNAIIKQADINPLMAADRTRLTKQLQFVRRTAPAVQISFASQPSRQALRVLVRWFRENGHPNTLISVGIQPNIAGGCVLRTANKEFDFSLQKLFQQNKPRLAKQLSNQS
jgi:hypothetical protein